MDKGIITAIMLVILAVLAIALGNLFLQYIVGIDLAKVPKGVLAFFHVLVICGGIYVAVKFFSRK